MIDQPNADEHPLEADVPEPPMLLTIKQAAGLLQVGRCTMQELVLDGEVQSLKIGRLRRVPRHALAAFVSARLAAEGER